MVEISDASSKEDLLEFIKSRNISEPIGRAVELYCDRFPVTEAERTIFEKFLKSGDFLNRLDVLHALIVYGHFGGYEADLLYLHFETRTHDSPTCLEAISMLRDLAEMGSEVAIRILGLLQATEYYRTNYRK